MSRIARLFPLLLVVAAGCQDRSTVPTANGPSFAAAAPAACPATPTVTVSDEAGLRTAIATAAPGAVIAIQGMIGLTQDDTIRTAGVTVTCATPGSGLFAVAGSGVQDLLIAAAKGDVVDRLVLDASQAGDSPLAGFNDGTTFFAESIRFTNNTGTCAPGGECVFIAGGLGAVVTDNHFEAPGSFSGIQLQVDVARVDGARIERNTLVATAPSIGLRQGGIRPADAAGVVIADNTVIGPWRNGLSAARLAHSSVQGNQFRGAVRNGIRLSDAGAVFLAGIPASDNVFSNNRITGSGEAGIFARLACRNEFIGNNLQGNAGDVGAILPDSSGANTLAGNGTIVVDDGAFDCDGDGLNDPNVITGAGAVRHGLHVGETVSGAVRTVRGITVQ